MTIENETNTTDVETSAPVSAAPTRKITIRHRWTDEVLYETEVPETDPMPLRTAVERASLDGARLDGASLDGASLDGASLDGARLVRARLDGASLVRARLDGIRDDIYSILERAPNEVPGLLLALRDGRVDGSVYEGDCACLIGTIANVRGCSYRDIGVGPNSDRPAERWFMAITPGLTPERSQIAHITVRWIEEWQAKRAAAAETAAP